MHDRHTAYKWYERAPRNQRERGWFVAADPLTYDSRLTVYGNVHLILADGCKVTANEGITVECAKDSSENTLTIYEQSEDRDMGVLEAFSPGGNSAAIGGISESYDSIITIHGGMVNASLTKLTATARRSAAVPAIAAMMPGARLPYMAAW